MARAPLGPYPFGHKRQEAKRGSEIDAARWARVLAGFAIGFALALVLGAFVFWNLDPAGWPVWGRGVFGVAGVAAGAGGFVLALLSEPAGEPDRGERADNGTRAD